MTSNESLQKWLALEHEAVWFYAQVGGRFDALAGAARIAYAAHVGAREVLLARLHRAGVEPVGTQLAYGVGTLRTPADARKFARSLESRVAAACLTLVGVVEGQDREFATTALRRAALAQLTWGARPSAFPGLPS
ncbi:MAG: hypothetical protein QOF76_1431 [Solirubrobacteraceae bacterium]|nr:hypothetical protein [Solirubrobacteraceae bacterium]